MDAEQMELLERLARLRELGALSRREFQREKEAVLRAPARPAAVTLRALPGPGQPATALALVPPLPARPRTPPRRRTPEPPDETTWLERAGRWAGWTLWILFSIGGLDALLDRDALQALSLLVCGLLLSPPFHRLLAMHVGLPSRLLLALLGVIAALEIGAGPARHASGPTPALVPKAALACGEAFSDAALAGGARAREAISRPWRKVWSDLIWARVAGVSVLEEWRAARG